MAEYQTFEHDVLVIGAGGAGLRAAVEASAAGVKVGLVCKSLLGKAHTVMAEGGIAAALANDHYYLPLAVLILSKATIDALLFQICGPDVAAEIPAINLSLLAFPTDNATGNFIRVVQRVPVKIRFTANPLPGRVVPGLSARVDIERGRS